MATAVSITLPKLSDKFKALSEKGLRFAIALACTSLAVHAKKELTESISTTFDRPTPYTKKAIYLQSANRNDVAPTALVYLKDKFPKHYLATQIEGGHRYKKRSEQLLRMGGSEQMQPASGLRLNKYGNIPKGTLTRILSAVKAYQEQGYLANQTKRSRKTNKKHLNAFIAGHGMSKTKHLQEGVYERKKGKIKPLLIFGRRAKYKKLWKFEAIANKAISKHYDDELEKALSRALS